MHPALSLPWIAAASPPAIKAWRILVVVAFVLIAVTRFGLWVWPPQKDASAVVANPLAIKATSFAGDYPLNTKIVGVQWQPTFIDLRLTIENPSADDYENVDLLIGSDLMTIFPTQITRIPTVTLIPEPSAMELPAAAKIGTDAQGRDVIIPTIPSSPDAGILAKHYRLLCDKLPHGAKIQLLLPSIATNKFTGDPNGYFAAKRDAQQVTVTGQFLAAGRKQMIDKKIAPASGIMPQP